MGKYHDIPLSRYELGEIVTFIDALHGLDFKDIVIDHIQIGDVNGDILGKLQFDASDEDEAKNGFTFHPRKHDKPGVLGE